MENGFEDLPLFSYGGVKQESPSDRAPGLRSSSSLSAAIQVWGEALESEDARSTRSKHSPATCAWWASMLARDSPSIKSARQT